VTLLPDGQVQGTAMLGGPPRFTGVMGIWAGCRDIHILPHQNSLPSRVWFPGGGVGPTLQPRMEAVGQAELFNRWRNEHGRSTSEAAKRELRDVIDIPHHHSCDFVCCGSVRLVARWAPILTVLDHGVFCGSLLGVSRAPARARVQGLSATSANFPPTGIVRRHAG